MQLYIYTMYVCDVPLLFLNNQSVLGSHYDIENFRILMNLLMIASKHFNDWPVVVRDHLTIDYTGTRRPHPFSMVRFKLQRNNPSPP